MSDSVQKSESAAGDRFSVESTDEVQVLFPATEEEQRSRQAKPHKERGSVSPSPFRDRKSLPDKVEVMNFWFRYLKEQWRDRFDDDEFDAIRNAGQSIIRQDPDYWTNASMRDLLDQARKRAGI